MRVLSQQNDVVWINYHGTRKPTLNKADVSAGFSVIKRFLRGVKRVSPSLVQLTPLVIPGVKNRWLRWIHQWMLAIQIRRAIRAVPGWKDKPLQVWSFAPDVPYLIGKFNEECFLYYCVDEHSQFEGHDPAAILAAEREQIIAADLVVTTSEALFEAKRKIRPDAILLRHGVDFERFATARERDLPRPSDLAGIPGPMFGFFGLLHFWIDTELLAYVAKRRPEYSFVLIGDCKIDVSALKRLRNVYFLGRKPNEELPAYCAAFDAGLLPFTKAPMTKNVNPIKMYEYLAAGLPAVSTPLPEAERFLGPITIVDTAEEFVLACDRVLETNYAGRRMAISRFVEKESWTSKVELLSEIVVSKMASIVRIATMPADRVVRSTPVSSDSAQQRQASSP